MTTKKLSEISLTDRLSRLSYRQACKMLGQDGSRLLRAGGKFDIDIDQQVEITETEFTVTFEGSTKISLFLEGEGRRLRWRGSGDDDDIEFLAATLSFILEEKLMLGLAAPPDERVPLESLTEKELVARELDDRKKCAEEEKMRAKSADPSTPWTDYLVTNASSGKTYRVALRGEERGQSFCACPDFRKNTLGTCKHILGVLRKVKQRFKVEQRQQPYVLRQNIVFLRYGESLNLHLNMAKTCPPKLRKLAEAFAETAPNQIAAMLRLVEKAEQMGEPVILYPDAEDYIQKQLFRQRISRLVDTIRKDPANHPLRKTLLKAELLPYQLDGIAFSVGAGRAILADDMGLGKTIQGMGVAELLAREMDIKRVLVICPASLKSQWKSEILRFSDRDANIVIGNAVERRQQYAANHFYTLCNYEQILRDLRTVATQNWDLIILDEGQRIKNWEAKTSNAIKSLRSPFALVLSGTPIENRLEELYSIVEFVDDRRLPPRFRFLNQHRMVDEKGKVLGYKNLQQLRETVQPILLRRTRAMVSRDLPPRTTEIIRIEPSEAQQIIHDTQLNIVSIIAHKSHINEMDLLRMRKALLMCRLVANSSILVDKTSLNSSTKLERLAVLVRELFQEPERKAVLFSEWTGMLDLIEPILQENHLAYVRLDGSVAQKKRQQLVNHFQNNSECRLFISTNAGATGLNLQAADTVINVDLPWTPALLEQRIGRAHRMGQKRPVQVFLLVTANTLEESLLSTLSAKHDLSLAALDMASDTEELLLTTSIEELQRRMEVLLGAIPDKQEDQLMVEQQTAAIRKVKVAEAGGQLLNAAFDFLGEMLPADARTPSPEVTEAIKNRLRECVEIDEQGHARLTISLGNGNAIDRLATTLAGLTGLAQPSINATRTD